MNRREEKPKPKCPVELTDLTHLTCGPRDNRRTWVRLEWDFEERDEWLKFGVATLRPQSDRRNTNQWCLEAPMANGITDFEHSTAIAVRLPIVGLYLNFMSHGTAHYTAFVDSSAYVYDAHRPDRSNFHVPRPGYDPRKHKGSHQCEMKECRVSKHLIIPEGFYVPPVDPELYEAVKGKKVEIIFGETGDN